MDRREFLAAGAVTAAMPTLVKAKTFRRPLGLNLFTVRGPLGQAPERTYQAVGKAGIQVLEVRPPQLEQHAAMMRDAGLRPVHMFIDSAIVTGAWDEWRAFMTKMAARYKAPAPAADAPRPALGAMIELAKRHGVQRIGTSMLLEGERGTAIEAINRAAGECAAAGLELYYHNHGYEFAGARGTRYLDRLRKELHPKVRLELDTFWVAISGEDPARVLDEWKGRVRSVHLKDLAAEAPRGKMETEVPPTAFRELGQGTLDWRRILRAAGRAGVEHYFIEMDFTPGDPVASVERCAAFLKKVEL